MSNVIPFRSKKFSENLAQRILDAEIEASLEDAVASYERGRARAAFIEMTGNPMEQLNKLLEIS